MGICNVTPDSFSDGGRHFALADALDHCQAMLADGADLIDVGGESTRPGAGRLDQAEELRRVIPLVKELAAGAVAVSIDTMRASVAAAALEAGALIVNDVSGGLADPAMLAVMADSGAVCVLMHWRGASDKMDALDRYTDVVKEVAAELTARAQAAIKAGVKESAIVLDPGFGFAKSGSSNWPLLANLDRLAQIGFPLLIGASRKRFLESAKGPSPRLASLGPAGRDDATAAVTTASCLLGAWCVRVHAVAASAAASRVAAAITAARQPIAPPKSAVLAPSASISRAGQGMIA
jgi:dihydropteroate synthase